MKVNLVGKEDISGVGTYTKGLKESLSQELELEFRETYSYLRPNFLNQVLLTRFKLSREADINHIVTQDLMSGFLIPKDETIVVTVHDIFPYLDYAGTVYSWMAKRYVKNLENKTDRIIAVSEFTKNQIIQNTGVKPEKIDVVYQGVDLDTFRPQEEKQEDYFLHVGSEIDRKNIEGLIEIFEEIAKEEDVKLIRVGKLTKKTEKLIEKSNLTLGTDVVYKSNISEERLVKLYSGARKLLFPSHAEGFGRPMLESLACDSPVVAYKKKPMSEILPEKMMVEYGDRKAFVRKALSENKRGGRSIAEQFKWEKTAEEVIKSYERA